MFFWRHIAKVNDANFRNGLLLSLLSAPSRFTAICISANFDLLEDMLTTRKIPLSRIPGAHWIRRCFIGLLFYRVMGLGKAISAEGCEKAAPGSLRLLLRDLLSLEVVCWAVLFYSKSAPLIPYKPFIYKTAAGIMGRNIVYWKCGWVCATNSGTLHGISWRCFLDYCSNLFLFVVLSTSVAVKLRLSLPGDFTADHFRLCTKRLKKLLLTVGLNQRIKQGFNDAALGADFGIGARV